MFFRVSAGPFSIQCLIQNVLYKVNFTLYRLHKHYFLRDSFYFHDVLNGPDSDEIIDDGSSDDKPFRLPERHKEDFENFLSIFYSRSVLPIHTVSQLSQSRSFSFKRDAS